MVEISASSRLYFALLPEALSLPCRQAVPQTCPFGMQILRQQVRLAR